MALVIIVDVGTMAESMYLLTQKASWLRVQRHPITVHENHYKYML